MSVRVTLPSGLPQSEYAARLSRAEGERQALAEALTGTERRMAEERHRAEEQQQQAKSARVSAENVKQELQDYKHKASRILQVRHVRLTWPMQGCRQTHFLTHSLRCPCI